MTLLIYPALVLILLLVKAKPAKLREYVDDGWGIQYSKPLLGAVAVLIVLHHLVQYVSSYGGIDKGPITVFNSLGILFTSLFFFFSGYGLMVSLEKKENYLATFLKKRLPAVLLPFYVSNIIYIPIEGIMQGRITNPLDLFTSMIGFTLINKNAWFVIEITILYLVFFLVFRLVKNRKAGIAVMTVFTLLMIAGSLLLGHDMSDVDGHWFMGEWWYNSSIVFPMGLIFGLEREKLYQFFKKAYVVILPVTAVLFFIMFRVTETVMAEHGYYTETKTSPGYDAKFISLCSQSVLCLIFTLLILLLMMKLGVGNKVLVFLGKICFEIYLIHGIFMAGYDIKAGTPDHLFFIFVLVLGILAGAVLWFIDDRLLRIIRKAAEGKNGGNKRSS